MKRLTFVFAMLLAGCATTAPSGKSMEATAGSIRAAEELGAPRVPQASLHLQLAKEQSQHAKQLVAKGDNARAKLLMKRANADAELAVALSRAAVATGKAQAAREKTQKLEANAP
jgi:hypothetical protein